MPVYLSAQSQGITFRAFLSSQFEMLIPNTCSTMTNKWFSGMTHLAATRCNKVLSFCGCSAFNGGSVVQPFLNAMDRVLNAIFTCILALGGSIIGTIAGGMKGHTTESGFLDGAGKGAIAGAIAAIELMDFAALDEPLSKVALLSSLLNGKVFMEWICPAVTLAYQLHINTSETANGEVLSDIYDVRGVAGMAKNFIVKLPSQKFNNSNKMLQLCNKSCCSVCFQDFEEGELVRILPKCGHIYHLECIDKWLIQQGSCPMCRTCICSIPE